MAHNGGRYQTAFNFPYITGAFPFCNKVKLNTVQWEYTAGGRPAASILNANGYPTSVAGGSLRYIVVEEGLTYRPGKRILAWDGNQTFTLSGASADSGQTLTGSGGRCVCVLSNSTSPKSVTITLTATDGLLTNLRWLHEDDETRYNSEKLASPNLEPWTQKFLDLLTDHNPGVLRFLDWSYGNASNCMLWSHRTPVGFYNYSVSRFDSTLYAGTLTGGPTTFTTSLVPAGFSLVDGATVQVDITGSTVGSGTTTLNVNGTGAKPIKNILTNSTYVAWTRSSTGTDRRGTFTYLSDLDVWVCVGGGTESFDEGLLGGVPPEIMMDLCVRIGSHGHFVPPCLSANNPAANGYVAGLAALAHSVLSPAGLQFRLEAWPNEHWNNAFCAYPLAQAYSNKYWTVTNIEDIAGRNGSLVGNVVKTEFGGDRTKYALLAGIKVADTPDNPAGTNTMTCLESTRYVADGGTPAKNFITHICLNNYWTTMNLFAGTVGTTAQQYLRFLEIIRQTKKWQFGTTAEKLQAVEWCCETTALNTWIDTEFRGRCDRWWAVAQNYVINGSSPSQKFGLTSYEGNYYPGDVTANAVHGIDGVTLTPSASPGKTIITINNVGGSQGHAFVAGMSCSFRSIGGTTQLNGNTYNVSAVTATTVTIDCDSTGFGTFTTGGSGGFACNGTGQAGIIYVGYGGPVTAPGYMNNFIDASRLAEGSFYGTQRVFNMIMEYAGAEFPSDFTLISGTSQWVKFADLYTSRSPQSDAMKLFNRRLRRKRITASP